MILLVAHIKPVALSASGCWLFDFCPHAYELHYMKHFQAKKSDISKLVISKFVHEVGAAWLNSSDRNNWKHVFQQHILDGLNKEKVETEKYSFFIEKITDLAERYIELLHRMRLHQKKISTEEMYGSTFKIPVQITETWAFTGAADIVVFNDGGDIVLDGKWSWEPEKLNQNQINIYATVHELIFKRPVIQIGFIVFGPQKIVTFNFDHQQRIETLEKMNHITTKILNNDFEATQESIKCKYCEYGSYCKQKIITTNMEELSNDGATTGSNGKLYNICNEPF